MNLTLSRRGDYTLRSALYLAEMWGAGGYANIGEISRAMGVPFSYTPQILGYLIRAELAKAKPGPGGGYQLTADPSTISVLAVVESAEGSLLSSTCILRGGPCRRNGECAIHGTWAAASESFRLQLRSRSLSDLSSAAGRPTHSGRASPGGR
jgi:Rrf2 family protein